MRVFITGATGYIGSAVACRLAKTGHEVTALVRSTADSGPLRSHGIAVVDGDLGTLPSLGKVLGDHDAIVHTAVAYGNDRLVELDRTAIAAFTQHAPEAHVVYTSGVWVLGNSPEEPMDEDTDLNPLAVSAWRAPHEQLVLSQADERRTVAVVRPGCVYGGRQSLLADWFAAANDGAPLQVIGPGTNRWAMVDLDDVALLYQRVLERRAGGILHAVDDSRQTMEEVAHAIIAGSESRRSTIAHLDADEARGKLGPYADPLLADQHVTSEKTRVRLAWEPNSRRFGDTIDEQWRVWRKLRLAA